MTEQSQSNEANNPLDDLAGDLSARWMGETVEVKNSSVEEVRGGQVKMTNSAVRSLHANAMDMRESAVAAAQVDSLEMHESVAGAVAGKTITIHGGLVGALAAEQVHAREITVGLLVAGKVEGDVKTFLTPAAAAAFGAAFAVTLAMLRLLFRRKSKSVNQ